ncbi:MAG: HesA/MoeB/ThiF family protein [Gammaproteobacteria bacterium]
MDDNQLLRYSRQIMLPEIDVAGQARLLESRVLIVGLGALGSPVSMYLATSGVGELLLMDPDRVELSNLQRQIVHSTASIGSLKVRSAQACLHALNPGISIVPLDRAFDERGLKAQIGRVDAVVDATDNFAARFAMNKACFETRTPLISGAAIRLEGQVSVYPFNRVDSPCYHCLYGDVEEPAASCAQTGVLGPVAGLVGCIQAIEAVKVLVGFGETLAGRLLLIDARGMNIRSIRLSKDPDCPVCGSGKHSTSVR